MIDKMTFTLNSPITEEQWDAITDVDFEHTNEITFHTKHGKIVKFVKVSAQPDLDEWCTDCKEYDSERHCCPRYNRVIREAVEEAKEDDWIPCSKNRLPKMGEMVLVTNGKGHVSYGKFRGVDFWLDNVRCYWLWRGKRAEWVLAWKPKPEPWKGEEHDKG